jgi:hypothetical protein
MCSEARLWKLTAGHLGNLAPKDLRPPLRDVVNELGAATDQRLPGADDGKVSLALLAPVLERIE